MNAQTTQIVVTVAVIVIVMALRFRRMNQMRPLRLEQMWVLPTIYIVLTALTLLGVPPAGLDWLWIVAIAAVGGAIGWYRGKMMQIHVDPKTHQLNQKASPLAMLLILGILGVRMVLRTEASSIHVPINLVTDASIAFVAAMFTMVRVEMFLRAQRLLAEARANGPPTASA